MEVTSAETTLTLLGAVLIASMVILMFAVSRKHLVLPIILAGCYITLNQQIVVGPLHFQAFRIVLLFGWLRLALRREIFLGGLNAIDKMLIVWVLAGSLINIILLHNVSEAAIINRLGFAYDVIGLYFFFRITLSDISDVKNLVAFIAFSILPLAFLMLVEKMTGDNPFTIFGGWFQPMVREGRYRATGPFISPIGAGTFGASLVPLFIGFWCQREDRSRSVSGAGLAASCAIVIAANSGAPLSVLALGVVCMALWRFRFYVKALMWIGIFCILYAHVFMMDPVWHLFARVSSVTGGGGWYRADLIDQAIKHFDEWCLYGTTHNAHWKAASAISLNPNMIDMTNQYLAEGMRGGVVTMILFIGVIGLCFHHLWTEFLRIPEEYFETRILVWSLGASLFTHAITLMSVSYFDQLIVFWYMLLGAISAVSWPEQIETCSESDE